MAKLTQKQIDFVDLYITTNNATQSYIDAGYKATTRKVADANARKLLANDSIKTLIKERMEQKDGEKIAKQDEILAYLTNVMRGKEREQTLMGMGMGEQTIADIDVGSKDRIKAAELLGKRYGMWTDKLDVNGAVVVNIVDDVDDLDDDEE